MATLNTVLRKDNLWRRQDILMQWELLAAFALGAALCLLLIKLSARLNGEMNCSNAETVIIAGISVGLPGEDCEVFADDNLDSVRKCLSACMRC